MILAFGKHKGKSTSDLTVPLSYLVWCWEQPWVSDELAAAALHEVLERMDIQARVAEKIVYRDRVVENIIYRDREIHPPDKLKKPVQRILKAGFRSVSHEAHPDHGGQTAEMRDLLEAREWLSRNVS